MGLIYLSKPCWSSTLSGLGVAQNGLISSQQPMCVRCYLGSLRGYVKVEWGLEVSASLLKCSLLIEGEMHDQGCKEKLCY